jgi:hypothetical protein
VTATPYTNKSHAQAVEDQRRWKLNKADWAAFQDLCSSELNATALKRSNNKFKEFTETLIKVANESIPKTSGKLRA